MSSLTAEMPRIALDRMLQQMGGAANLMNMMKEFSKADGMKDLMGSLGGFGGGGGF